MPFKLPPEPELANPSHLVRQPSDEGSLVQPPRRGLARQPGRAAINDAVASSSTSASAERFAKQQQAILGDTTTSLQRGIASPGSKSIKQQAADFIAKAIDGIKELYQQFVANPQAEIHQFDKAGTWIPGIPAGHEKEDLQALHQAIRQLAVVGFQEDFSFATALTIQQALATINDSSTIQLAQATWHPSVRAVEHLANQVLLTQPVLDEALQVLLTLQDGHEPSVWARLPALAALVQDKIEVMKEAIGALVDAGGSIDLDQREHPLAALVDTQQQIETHLSRAAQADEQPLQRTTAVGPRHAALAHEQPLQRTTAVGPRHAALLTAPDQPMERTKSITAGELAALLRQSGINQVGASEVASVSSGQRAAAAQYASQLATKPRKVDEVLARAARQQKDDLIEARPDSKMNWITSADIEKLSNTHHVKSTDIVRQISDAPMYSIGEVHLEGKRRGQEDTSCVHFKPNFLFGQDLLIAGVFDGHGGKEVSHAAQTIVPETIAAHLASLTAAELQDPGAIRTCLKNAFAEKYEDYKDKQALPTPSSRSSLPTIAQQLRENLKKGKEFMDQGSTAVVMVQLGQERYIVNLGDSRATLVSPDGSATRLSYDHSPSDKAEEEKVQARGGKVLDLGLLGHRVGGVLAVARALGDEVLKGAGSSPEYAAFGIGGRCQVTKVPSDGTIVLACDGLYEINKSSKKDVLIDEEVAQFVHQQQQRQIEPKKIASHLAEVAIARGSYDNVSVMILQPK